MNDRLDFYCPQNNRKDLDSGFISKSCKINITVWVNLIQGWTIDIYRIKINVEYFDGLVVYWCETYM